MEDDSYVELLKLQKLFEANFSLSPSHVDKTPSYITLEEAHLNDVVVMTLTLRPTDPDFNLSQLGNDKGVNLRLSLHRSTTTCAAPPQSQSQTEAAPTATATVDSSAPTDGSCYTINGASDIDIRNENIPRDVKLVIKKALLAFLSKNHSIQRYAVYESLKFLDRELRHIFELCESKRAKSDTPDAAETVWSLQEQKSLEFAISKTKGIADSNQRWAAVASVVKTKTAEECRRRFQRCREQLMNKVVEESKAVTAMPAEYQTVLARSERLRLIELNLVKISVFNIVSFDAQLVCTRCESPFDVTIVQGEKKIVEIGRSCENCHMAQRLQFQPQIAFRDSSTIGNLSLENCLYRDFIRGEFYVTCEDCDTQCKLRDVQSGSLKSGNCRGCFAKLTLGFNTVDFGSEAAALQDSVSTIRKPPPRVIRPRQPAARGLKVGTPLPENGACKHYKKSFRWFRFPCCGKLFPCDSCHDENSDHPYEQVHMIVCGHCSTPQPVSNKKCRNCDKGYSGSTSSYWEGGKGCRDATKLNRRDSKKYRLMRRQMEQAKGGDAKKGK